MREVGRQKHRIHLESDTRGVRQTVLGVDSFGDDLALARSNLERLAERERGRSGGNWFLCFSCDFWRFEEKHDS